MTLLLNLSNYIFISLIYKRFTFSQTSFRFKNIYVTFIFNSCVQLIIYLF